MRKQDAIREGWQATPLKHDLRHIEWLVDYQIKEMGFLAISNKIKSEDSMNREPYLSDDTKKVRKAINELAKTISLPLRSEGRLPGRRPKSKKNTR